MSRLERPLLLVVSSHGAGAAADPDLVDETTWRVERARSASEALSQLSQAPARLVVSDLSLPDAGDLAVVGQACRRDPGVRFLHLVTDLRRRQHGSGEDGRFAALPLSAPGSALRQAVARRLGGPAWFPPPAVRDHLRLCALGGLTSGLSLSDAGGSEMVFEVVFGELWSAAAEAGEGERVVAGLLDRAVGQISTFPLRNPHERRNVFSSMVELLAPPAARQAPGAGPIPAVLNSVPGAPVPARAARAEPRAEGRSTASAVAEEAGEAPAAFAGSAFDLAFAEGLEATLARDYERAVSAFARAQDLRPTDARVRFNLERVRRRLMAP